MKDCKVSLDWSFKGFRALILENKWIRLACLPGKGSDIIEITYKPLDINLLWNFELANVDRESLISNLSSALGSFLDFYLGGWQDILPSAGHGPVNYRGADFGLHGETSTLSWDCVIEEDSKDRVRAKLSVRGRRYPYKVEKWISLEKNETIIKIRERLTNLANHELEFSWLQHPAFGEPFLQEGVTINVPAREVISDGKFRAFYGTKEGKYKWPKVMDTEGRERDLSLIPSRNLLSHDVVFLSSLDEGWYAITNKKLNLGFGLRWNKKIFPFIWFWQNYNTPNYPWYGKAWNIALEPCSSIPGTGLAEQVREGNFLKLEAGESLETEIIATIYTNYSKVKRIDEEGKVLGD
ncbi:MAG: DUF4432 family protein [Nitrososphaerales archaeon]